MRVVLDTNVLISSTFWSGASSQIIDKIENKEIELVLSKEIIEEFSAVLQYEEIQMKVRDKDLEMKRTIDKIISMSIIVEPIFSLDIIKEDSDDNKIIMCAVEGKADYIISQDNHLLRLGSFAGISILTPEEFIKIISKT